MCLSALNTCTGGSSFYHSRMEEQTMDNPDVHFLQARTSVAPIDKQECVVSVREIFQCCVNKLIIYILVNAYREYGITGDH